jgi:hypothetical protein
MSLTQRLIGRCAILDSKNDVVAVDLTGFVRRLILFDRSILESVRLKELPLLLNVFGYDGFVTLIRSAAFTIHCDAFTIGQTGQLKVLESRVTKGLLPLCSYAFSTVRIPDWYHYMDECLRILDPVTSISSPQRKRLKNLITSSAARYPSDFGTTTLKQLKTDLAENRPVVRRLVKKTLAEQMSATVKGDVLLRVHPIDDSDFRVETDIAERLHLSELDTHRAIERALLAAGGLNQRIEQMRTYSAISGFLPEEVRLFAEKLDFLINALLPQRQEERFQRVLTIKGLPELDRVNANTRIDVDRLLKIRDSVECREFRAWLSSTDYASDSEIREKVDSLRSKVSALMRTKPGTALRFATITGIGLVPIIGTGLGVLFGALDQFLFEKVFPYSGPASFVNRLYPSIFKNP